MGKLIGVDLFSGAGGMTQGATMAGVDVRYAVEFDPHAAQTYRSNHSKVEMYDNDITTLESIPVKRRRGQHTILFGGPPCQGFSTSNQRTRNKKNPKNWLFREFIRLTKSWEPDWIVFENVRGITETEKGAILEQVINELDDIGYTCSSAILNAANHGVPQRRSRLFVVGSRHGATIKLPTKTADVTPTVKEAFDDLPDLLNGAKENVKPYKPDEALSDYASSLRRDLTESTGHLVSRNADFVLERYVHIPPGGNWEDIPDELMKPYADKKRCHTGIFHRLDPSQPSIVIGNYRKNMLVHPTQHRGLSVREAARIQSFPDNYNFSGSIGFQQQQVGNAVPPLLAKAVFDHIRRAPSYKP